MIGQIPMSFWLINEYRIGVYLNVIVRGITMKQPRTTDKCGAKP